jgi:hypothetical protein
MSGNVDTFMSNMSSVGSTYRFGGGCNCSSALCNHADCSEVIKWAACRSGVSFPDGTWVQYRAILSAGLATTPQRALHTRGALLFIFSSNPLVGGRPSQAHVAVSNGDGLTTTECRSTASGCGVFSNASKRGWTHAGLIPQFNYSKQTGVASGGAGGYSGEVNGDYTPPSVEWKPPGTVGPPPSPPPPPPPPVGTPLVGALSSSIQNILGSKECGRSKNAYRFRNPNAYGQEWIGNGILKCWISPTDDNGLRQRGYSAEASVVSTETFESMLDITGW